MDSSIDQRLRAEQKAIEGCEREELRFVGRIQPFGALLALSLEDFSISHVSANLEPILGRPSRWVLGQSIGTLLPPHLVHDLRGAASHPTIERQRELVGSWSASEDAQYDLFIHQRGRHLLVEFQQQRVEGVSAIQALDRAQTVMARASRLDEETELLQAIVHDLRGLTGFDRVKAYRFLPDGSGEVVAESRVPAADSFLGLRFPAFDIPQAARDLYAKTPVRTIPDVEAEPIPLLAVETETDELDLALAVCRGVPDVHLLYLRNMGVRATLTLPLVVDGELWGLFALHHGEARTLPSSVLSAAELIGGNISLVLQGIVHRRRLSFADYCSQVAGSLFPADESPLGYSAHWDDAKDEVASLVPCDGVAMLGQQRVYTTGSCAPEPSIRRILAPVLEQVGVGESKPVALDSIREQHPDLPLDDAAGCLILTYPIRGCDALVFFRNASHKQLRWAGAPQKSIERQGESFRLNPRASFREYLSTVEHRCDVWSPEDSMIVEALGRALDQTAWNADSQRRHRKRLGLVIRELNHRVQNMLALVASIVMQTRQDATDIESYAVALQLRITALANAHRLLTEADWEPVDLRTLAEQTLRAFDVKESAVERIQLVGSEISIEPDLASLLALVLHELGSNSSRYGSLTGEAGSVLLRWSEAGGVLQLDWEERGGPEVREPVHEGFGTSIIRHAMQFEFDAECSLEFPPTGVRAQFRIPIDRSTARVGSVESASASESTSGPRALVVEDDFVIAAATAGLLRSLGAGEVVVASTLQESLDAIAGAQFDFCVVDFDLRGEPSTSLMKRLTSLGVPFVVVTGFSSADEDLRSLGSLATLSKPLDPEALARALRTAGVVPASEGSA